MKRMMKEAAKTAAGVVLGLVYLWFVMSFAWSQEAMSGIEQAAGFVYMIAVVPLYWGICELIG